MSRLSTTATSTLVPALKVRSTTWPVSTFLSFVRTNAPPLPGLTCWNSTTFHRTPSRSSVIPFFRSLGVAMRERLPSAAAVAGEQPAYRQRKGRQSICSAAPSAGVIRGAGWVLLVLGGGAARGGGGGA